MADLVTNADDVELFINPRDGSQFRISANEFTISNEQGITTVHEIGRNQSKGLTKGDIDLSFDFMVEGDDGELMSSISDENGDSIPFDFTARKKDGEGSNTLWEYALQSCLADTEEISGTTGEALEMSVEGMASGFDKLV